MRSFSDLEGFEELNVVGVNRLILVDILDIRILVDLPGFENLAGLDFLKNEH
ncbi:hypothetical protein A33Q_1885 [Indibacter alkaliphilus LW1]|uniref:Uncharacterized protein n=1 Tax=Indibacter alkaliphilus (strain CCUG 57479 / KCTC 22604 / LW1) TaxID=1189612 RepID=S2DCR5_INDAL|nr:hypothetical protein [Indibacter alkaliphilus]EOZ96967.1 hypothetical protein A33Q_1885 [Indibacter alkaliphilus LW1]